MKNITVSVEDDVYRKARMAAAAADASVSGLVRQFLNAFVAEESPLERKDAPPADRVLAVVEKMRQRHPHFDPSKRLSREEVHFRAGVE